MTENTRADEGNAKAKKIRDEAARKRVLTNAATVLSIDPKVLLDRAEIEEVLGEIKEILEALRDSDEYAAEDQRIRDELLYAMAKNLVISPGGGESLFAARTAFKARFLPEVGVPEDG